MSEFSLPWDDLPAPQLRPPKPADEKTERRPPTHRQKAAAKQARQDRADAEAAAADTGIIWQWWHLVVHGPAEEVATFAAAARGPGFIPWRIDKSGFHEDVLTFVFGSPAPPSLSVADCRILARRFRDVIEASHARNERHLHLRSETARCRRSNRWAYSMIACPTGSHQ